MQGQDITTSRCCAYIGSDVSPIETFWVGVSYFLAGGSVEHSATNLKKVDVVSLTETTREPN
jgi:hypothetical protein